MSLPAGWQFRRLEELAASEPSAITDGPFGSNLKSSDYVESGARVIRLGNIGVGYFVDKDRSFVSMAKFNGLRKHAAVAGDLVIAALAEPVGRACLVPSNLGPTIVKADCIRFRPGAEIDVRFLMYALNSPQGLAQTESSAHGLGRLRVNLGEVRALSVPVPPLNVQRRIVTKLDELLAVSRAAREQLDAVPALVETFRQSVLAAAFRGDLTADWRKKNPNVEPASKLLERIRTERRRQWEAAQFAKMKAKGTKPKDGQWKEKYVAADSLAGSTLPKMPSTWCSAAMGEVASVALGKMLDAAKNRGRELPYLRNVNVRWGEFSLDDLQEMRFEDAELDRFTIQAGDLVACEGGEPGRCAVWNDTTARIQYQKALHRMRPHAGILPRWLMYQLWSHSLSPRLAQFFTGTTIKHLSREAMLSVPVAIPPLQEQRALVDALDRALESMKSYLVTVETSLADLENFERSALARAFAGQLVG